MPEAFADHLAEAVQTLGYFRVAAIPALLDMYAVRWEDGTSYSMLKAQEIAPLLTDKGRSNPRHAQMATFLRASFNLNRQEHDQRERAWSKIASKVRFSARATWLCEDARSLDGTIVERTERWHLPLPDCGQEWCPCRWDFVIDT
jgi:hypothetical protein